jgi:hypothetical protein
MHPPWDLRRRYPSLLPESFFGLSGIEPHVRQLALSFREDKWDCVIAMR